MPTNLYGPNDNYHPEHSHVLPALIRRFHEAKESGAKSVTCWGDGSPLREFLYVDDLANLCVFLMNNYSGNETVNAGSGKELSIKELTELVASIVGYEGRDLFGTRAVPTAHRASSSMSARQRNLAGLTRPAFPMVSVSLMMTSFIIPCGRNDENNPTFRRLRQTPMASFQ